MSDATVHNNMEMNNTDLGTQQTNIWAPFSSRMDWEIARWEKLQGPSSTAFSDLLAIDGVVEALGLTYKDSNELNAIIDRSIPGNPHFQCKNVAVAGETYQVYFRDIIECIKALFGDPEIARYLVFAPERHYANAQKTVRLYHDMHTGDWWWTAQEAIEKQLPGATIIPVIISSDKTQVTLFRNKTAYPVYLTIGNIPKEIRRKLSQRSYVLLAYLPTTRLEHLKSKASRRRAVANIFHACMGRILSPLKEAGLDGIAMTTGMGFVHRTHPLLAAYSGDYLEQILVAGIKSGECPECEIPRTELGSFGTVYPTRDLVKILDALSLVDQPPQIYGAACHDAGIKPIYHPFWEDLPYADIYLSIAPDILHQLYQGILKHPCNWIKSAYDNIELDARCRSMPPNCHTHLFSKGITTLSRLTGQEHSYISSILLGLIIDQYLPNNIAVRAMLDFVFTAQYPVHTMETLQSLEDSLEQFHANKDIFIDLGIRHDFKIPKLHCVSHWKRLIEWFGTPDNFNTEYTERLHIDFAKKAYRASNHRDEFSQMTIWLERKEKILKHDKFIQWCLSGCPHLSTVNAYGNPPPHCLIMTKHPSLKSVDFDDIINKYQAILIKDTLAKFIIQFNNPAWTSRQAETHAAGFTLLFNHLAVYHKAKFWLGDQQHPRLASDEYGVIHAKPGHINSKQKSVPGRFDTVLVNTGSGLYSGLKGYWIGQVQVFISPQITARPILPLTWRQVRHLAYVEWFSPLRHPVGDHGLYRISRSIHNGYSVSSVIPLANIHRSVHLFPRFGISASQDWTSTNVLEKCDSFYLNCFSDRHAYATMF
ncbi:hypothetical protein WOLCODRAFT_89528 [Wolfiporia cocos MD-104 SS10]|uniref:Uncharacterized protein n=1 Tax=Wolfiporia cocos (strain MD-104) TaxID=742152 RepID=A0A2H3JK07_WOLCO|nr:hypothetical protein WOLCODRAFT_89528 [Wolfiporia cocos MD-104 SS10]